MQNCDVDLFLSRDNNSELVIIGHEHLNRYQARKLAKALLRFADTGKLE